METTRTIVRHTGSRFTLADNPIVSLEDRVIDFQETRFRVVSSKFMLQLRPLANELALQLNVDVSSLFSLSLESDSSLASNTYCVFDFLNLSSTKRRGIVRSTWAPIVVFHCGNRVLSLHASYKGKEASLSSLSLVSSSGVETTSSCTSIRSATKVCRSHIRSFLGSKDL